MAGPGALLLLGGLLGGLPQIWGGPGGAWGGSGTPPDLEEEVSIVQRSDPQAPHCFTRTLHDLSCFWDSPGPAEPRRFRLQFRLEQDPWQDCPLSATALSPPRGSRFWCSLPPAATVAFVPLELRVLPGTPPGTPPKTAGTPPKDTGTTGTPPGTTETPPKTAGTTGTPPGTTETPPKTAGTTPKDTGTPPKTAGTPPNDTGTTPKTAGTPPKTAGTTPKTAGTTETPPKDTGTPPKDTGTPPNDTGTTESPPKTAGTPPNDTGTTGTPPGTPPKTSETTGTPLGTPTGTPPKTAGTPPGTPPNDTGTTGTTGTPPVSPLFQRTLYIDQVVLPGPPQNVSVTAGGARGELCVRWAPPPGIYLHSSLVFELALSPPGGPPKTVGVPAGRREQGVGGLRGSTPYSVRARARPDGLSYGGFWGPWSEPATATTQPDLDSVTLGLSVLLVLLLLGLGALGLLGHRRALRAKLWPPVPGPEREFEGLFSNCGGNFQLWLCQGPGSPWAPPPAPPPIEAEDAVEEVGEGPAPPPTEAEPSAPPLAPPPGPGPSPSPSFEYTLFDPGSALLRPSPRPGHAPSHGHAPYANLAPPPKPAPPKAGGGHAPHYVICS